MPTLREAREKAALARNAQGTALTSAAEQGLTTFKETQPYGGGESVFQPFQPAPGGSYYRERAQGGFELVTPESGGSKGGEGGGSTYLGGGGTQFSRVPSGGGGGLNTISSTPVRQPQLLQAGQSITNTSTYVPPSGAAPTFRAPSYKEVGYDARRVSFLRQQAAAPARRAATQALQRAFTSSYASGPLRDMAIRNALQQYGSAYAQIMAGAGSEARAEYGAETAERRAANLAEYQGALSGAQTEFNALWTEWMKSGTTQTTQTVTPMYNMVNYSESGVPVMTPVEGAAGGVSPSKPLRTPERITRVRA